MHVVLFSCLVAVTTLHNECSHCPLSESKRTNHADCKAHLSIRKQKDGSFVMIGSMVHSHELKVEDLKLTCRQKSELKRILLEEKSLTISQIRELPSLNTTTNAELSGTHLVSVFLV